MNEDEFKKIQKKITKEMELRNRMPVEDFDNLSPEDVHRIMYFPFQEGCCIQFKEQVADSVLDQSSFFKLMEAFVAELKDKKEIKLTTRGNLPVRVVKSLYEKGFIKENMIESGLYKLSKEADSHTIENAKIIADIMGLTKKRYGKLSLTKKGEQLTSPSKRYDFFKEIFMTYGFRFNLGYHDGYPQETEIQRAVGYTVYLLLKYGQQERKSSFFSNKILTAFPHMLFGFEESPYRTADEQFTSCFQVRIIVRFFKWFDLVQVFDENKMVNKNVGMKNKLIDQIFEIKKENFQFVKPKFNA